MLNVGIRVQWERGDGMKVNLDALYGLIIGVVVAVILSLVLK